MAFAPGHWRNPRKTIATKFHDDDIAYATHGALLAMEVVRRLNISGDQAKDMHLLDYGCGTARVARVLAGYFGHVTGYDPVSECIAEGLREARNIPQHNLKLVTNLDGVAGCDVVASINVIEHLTRPHQDIMLDSIKKVAKKGSSLLLWYSLKTNLPALTDHFGRGAWVDEDNQFMENHPGCTIQVRRFLL